MRIQFDLPERAQVHVQIVDLLGREVMVLSAQEMEAGANRSIELNAIRLASGTYLYRLIASRAKYRHVKTGRMTLVKQSKKAVRNQAGHPGTVAYRGVSSLRE